MKKNLNDLDDHLFAAIERLNDEDLSAEQIESESKRADAIVGLADKIIDNSRTKLSAAKLWAEHGERIMPMLPKLTSRAE